MHALWPWESRFYMINEVRVFYIINSSFVNPDYCWQECCGLTKMRKLQPVALDFLKRMSRVGGLEFLYYTKCRFLLVVFVVWWLILDFRTFVVLWGRLPNLGFCSIAILWGQVPNLGFCSLAILWGQVPCLVFCLYMLRLSTGAGVTLKSGLSVGWCGIMIRYCLRLCLLSRFLPFLLCPSLP